MSTIYKLHYAKLNLQGDIPFMVFKTWRARLSFIMDKIIIPQKRVYLLSISRIENDLTVFDNVYVFDSYHCVRFLNDKKYNSPYDVFSLHEYSSYEEAYKVALDMKEISPLCYFSNDN